ncbi:glycoside hydrolase family 2 TIM barrel-domain containing protein [Wenyingzhuangia sp. chi5]|uniref:Glycoside hydrolase family 2 TIM barrel-domain containing protein n=1 Tax=Wenyingzhuangia gilva TaxID=3057677 RepID=A0ABT8VUG5_9FLAO|nr:glycoside hydrolase family 2 TIM barrel-domain containing protein [Wenyingzhuangia sp. chi5]MDO3695560.1 glycoside hydrolase family 2 TIM barrel-domain containing protein [Wenyingzhuangia sp. chi5]
MIKIYKTLILIVFTVFFSTAQTTSEGWVNFNSNWKFTKGNPTKAKTITFDDSLWEEIKIPHDWAIKGPFDPNGNGGTGKLPWKGEGWYRKKLTVNSLDKSKEIYVKFDGIMSSPKIYVNGTLAGEWDYGYSTFYLNISKHIKYGEKNTIAIYVDTRNHGSRWYPGAGIYRKVEIKVSNKVHKEIWGTYITTPVVKKAYAEMRVLTNVINKWDKDQNVTVKTTVISPEGKQIQSFRTKERKISSKNTLEFDSWMTITKPTLWSLNCPILYTLKTDIIIDGQVVDSSKTSFGFRSFKFTANDGLFINDQHVQIKGVNLHHDHGPLGAAFNKRSMERKLEIMKEMGCNAIRTSHNICAPELIELCDKMGILVFNEAFDKYDNKADIHSHTDFYEYGERIIKNFVMRDRNSPSVIIWSVGNEMGDIQGNSNYGLQKLAAMVGFVKKYDITRPVTMACDQNQNAHWRHFDYYDLHAYNYSQRWLPARTMEPSKSVVISESASTVSTRGYYDLKIPEDFLTPTKQRSSNTYIENIPESVVVTKQKNESKRKASMPFVGSRSSAKPRTQVSSYDTEAPSWAEVLDDDFMWQENDRYISGEFVWTGFDYLGEPTPIRSARSSYFGIVDLCGMPKDRYFLYQSYWRPDYNMVHVLPHWNWKGNQGKNVPVFVYTNGDEAELFLNGKSLGKKAKKPQSNISKERYRLMWLDVKYEPGELKAVAYKQGKVIGEKIIKTAGNPYKIKLSPDRSVINANGDDLSYIMVEAYDKEGNLCPLADNMVNFEIKGSGQIAAVGNGNPQSLEPYIANYRKLFYGKAMLIIKSKEQKPGKIKVTATSNGLKTAKISITTK